MTVNLDAGVLAEALAKIQKLFIDGLQHGFFEFSITCVVVKGEKRQIIIHAGKSYQYVIPSEECRAKGAG